ncbi:hypothetical protein TRFO_10697 [Tritrichomonas foetus]|uniref:Uncharacterized protein n=1 Tax=Tritrichomonas foetus TaxID=1144522 RepID=A0A1J4JCK4_9EUKA|nr:hypothetical protein TRFO_10697 [Tritrichomonas foetus]|eukprot:OHS95004.1 hypothetical protein TRFO_10697 [Tritrichomonas foetus]
MHEALTLLISNGAVIDAKAVKYAFELNDIESARILIANTDDEKLAKEYNKMGFEIAQNFDDPSLELMLLSNPPLESALGIEFIKQLYNRLNSEITAVSTKMKNDKSNIPKLIQEINVTNHRLFLFSKLINMKIESLSSELDVIVEQAQGAFENPETDKTVRSIIQSWSDKLNETNKTLETLRQRIVTPNGVKIYEKWHTVIEKRKEFIENLLDHGIEENLSLKKIDEQKIRIENELKKTKQFASAEPERLKFKHSIVDFINDIENNVDEVAGNKKDEVLQIISLIREEINIPHESHKPPRKPSTSRLSRGEKISTSSSNIAHEARSSHSSVARKRNRP